jgi:hypothetical protein
LVIRDIENVTTAKNMDNTVDLFCIYNYFALVAIAKSVLSVELWKLYNGEKYLCVRTA